MIKLAAVLGAAMALSGPAPAQNASPAVEAPPAVAPVPEAAPADTPSRVWLEIHVEEPGETVDVQIPAEWVNEEILATELEEDLRDIDFEAVLAEMKKMPIGSREQIVTVDSPDENVRIYLEHRAIDTKAAKAQRLLIDVHEDKDRIRINLRLPLARALMKAAIHFGDDASDQEVIALSKIVDQMKDMEPFEMVHVVEENEEVWIRLE